MANTAILYNAPSGFPGDISRPLDTEVDSLILGEAFPAFGVPYKLSATTGKAMKIESGDAAAVFKGIISRSVPSQAGSMAQGFDDSIPDADQPCGGVIEGYVMVKCTIGTPVKGQPVYMRVTAGGGETIGTLETGADGGDCVALVGVQWASNGKDADNVAEIYIK